MSKKSPIYLVGMMGVGKSTVGRALAGRLDRPFLDTDQEVERRAGRTIAEIFETDGEAHFRALEADAIETASREAAVIALGGGAVCRLGAIERLLEQGTVVFLMAEPAVLLERVGDPASRPLLAGLDVEERIEKLTSLLAERLPFYEKATLQIDGADDPDTIVDRILEELVTLCAS